MSEVNRDNTTGRFVKTPKTIDDIKRRLMNKIKRTDDCWNWTGALIKGYGKFSVDNKAKEAHRVSYEIFVGEIPKGMVLDHLCRNPSCVNPEHLEPVTHAENVKRGNAGQNWAAKTHCPQQHEYTQENTYIDTKGSRNCRECKNMKRRKAYKLQGVTA